MARVIKIMKLLIIGLLHKGTQFRWGHSLENYVAN